MLEKVKDVRPPRGLARFGFRLPIGLYRLGLGGLLGKRFLLLTHTGRKTGLERQTVLEVVRFDQETSTLTVAAGFGTRSDWYQNIRANQHVVVQFEQKRWPMVAEFLSPVQSGEILLSYARNYPRALKMLAGFLGYRLDGSPESIRALGQDLALLACHMGSTGSPRSA